ncbi:LysR family transcriptional regulator, partial [Mesorhizobium australicum]|uniref:LysR family transcriptional regulator n=1 Tax=Mesorhizobium australicum TaxID=536018 RepID=UPI0033377964
MARRTIPTLPPLDWLRSFEAAARLSNFTAAAAELGLTQAAVSQHIRLLEERLKTRLFSRLARGVALAPAGAAYLPHIQSAFATIGSSTTELFEPRAVQTVSIRVPISFALLALVPALPDLAEALPRIQLDLVTIHRPTDYDLPGSALDIRFGNGSFPGREAERLTAERLVPVANPALASAADWTSLPLLLVAGAREMWAEWFSAAGLAGHPQRSHRFDSFVAARQAARPPARGGLGGRPPQNPPRDPPPGGRRCAFVMPTH